ncbi:MAG TPA: PilW family protein [Rhodanobacteraceae bacterium]|nr:PilW family protein [Rhodanobacteraceae bacterium]
MKAPIAPRRSAGVSLIELMVALVIAGLITIGITQIFVGSKVAYQVQEGLSRIQENSRFTLQYLERNVRLAGYMGCGNDIARVPPNNPASVNYPYDTRFRNHLVKHGDVPPAQYRFQRPLEGFNANANPNNEALAAGGASDWTPQLPAKIVEAKPVKGSDVLVLRILGEESTPIVSQFTNAGSFKVADPDFVKANGVYAIENCGATPTYGFSEIFQASSSAGGNITAVLGGANVLQVPGSDTLTWNNGIGFSSPVGSPVNSSVHQAQYLAIFVALNDDGVPVLKVQHFENGSVTLRADELADNVENIQLLFGRDTTVPRDDTVDDFKTADFFAGVGTAEQQDTAWQKVISVRIGLLVRSPDSNSGTSHDAAYQVAGESVNPQNDHRVRQVYETTVALRNRIFNS